MPGADPGVDPTAAILDGYRRGELLCQRCEACARAQFYPRILCRHCGSQRLRLEPSSGRGTLYSFTRVERGPTRDWPVPYTLALVDLDEGFRLLVTLEVPESSEPAIGQPVRIVFDQATPRAHLTDEV